MSTRIWVLAAMVLFLTAGKLDRMSSDERAHWRALRVFIEEKDQRKWLRLKTEEQRNEWLKENGYWDRFYRHDPSVRAQIVAGDVRLGWSREMLYMAWGAPTQRLKLTGRQASRSERLIYRFEVFADGTASPLVGKNPSYKAVDRYQMNVTLDDNEIAELKEIKGWED